MTKSYSEKNKREIVYEPNLSRQRLSYLGPVPSHVLNLYYDQFVVDCAILNQKAEDLLFQINQLYEKYAANYDLATPNTFDETDLDATIYFNYINFDRDILDYTFGSSTPYYLDDVSFNTYAINSSKLSLIQEKVRLIEDLIAKKE